ncbi:hypothetical protein ACN6K6_000639 [Streptomyces violaceoruber]|uniref:hypothetical protein n=1 Tax=Streptomyces violaceoruber group TaxID=2867121 RepID=UPI00365D48BF
MSTLYDPLHDSDGSVEPNTHTVSVALAVAKESLADLSSNNIHSEGQMLAAATELHFVLRQLVIALDAERGEQR